MTDGPGPSVAILADDLIWSTRLASIVERAGALPLVVGSDAAFLAALDGSAGAIVDLAVRRAEPIAAIAAAAAHGTPAVAVGPHVDAAARDAALAAGARRAFTYRKLFEDGPRVVSRALGIVRDDAPTAPVATGGRGASPAR